MTKVPHCRKRLRPDVPSELSRDQSGHNDEGRSCEGRHDVDRDEVVPGEPSRQRPEVGHHRREVHVAGLEVLPAYDVIELVSEVAVVSSHGHVHKEVDRTYGEKKTNYFVGPGETAPEDRAVSWRRSRRTHRFSWRGGRFRLDRWGTRQQYTHSKDSVSGELCDYGNPSLRRAFGPSAQAHLL